MKSFGIIFCLLIIYAFTGIVMAQNSECNKLTPKEKHVLIEKGTEKPFTGEYTDHSAEGLYVCKQCESPLYRSQDKFSSNCGWPSFDDEIEGTVLRIPDPDGKRMEIVCANCQGHLGHVFLGEAYTGKNTRHCVNSVSLKFIPAPEEKPEKAIFGGGCFWGVEYYMEKIEGVEEVVSGFTGKYTRNNDSEGENSQDEGQYEVVEVSYNPDIVSYEMLVKTFFEIHDPTQVGRQGPDVGEEYQSVIFYKNEEQKEIAQKFINILKEKGFQVSTKLFQASDFYPAQDHHQNYYKRKGTPPTCHQYIQRF